MGGYTAYILQYAENMHFCTHMHFTVSLTGQSIDENPLTAITMPSAMWGITNSPSLESLNRALRMFMA